MELPAGTPRLKDGVNLTGMCVQILFAIPYFYSWFTWFHVYAVSIDGTVLFNDGFDKVF